MSLLIHAKMRQLPNAEMYVEPNRFSSKCSIADIRLGSKYASGTPELTSTVDTKQM